MAALDYLEQGLGLETPVAFARGLVQKANSETTQALNRRLDSAGSRIGDAAAAAALKRAHAEAAGLGHDFGAGAREGAGVGTLLLAVGIGVLVAFGVAKL